LGSSSSDRALESGRSSPMAEEKVFDDSESEIEVDEKI
jgi:hypothetical protein